MHSAGKKSLILAELKAGGFRPDRKKGQNFLFDPQLLRAFLDDANVTAGELILEVGSGAGTLTEQLLHRGCKVVGVELDATLADFLTRRISHPGFLLLPIDVLQGKNSIQPRVLESLAERGDSFRLIANLPYAIATPLMSLLVTLSAAPVRFSGAGVLVQRECAERWISPPGSKAYGSASVAMQLLGAGKITRSVARGLFSPPPQVDSCFFTWSPYSVKPPWDSAGQRFSQKLFQQRRKMIRAQLKVSEGCRLDGWQSLGFTGEERPDACSPEQIAKLYRALIEEKLTWCGK